MLSFKTPTVFLFLHDWIGCYSCSLSYLMLLPNAGFVCASELSPFAFKRSLSVSFSVCAKVTIYLIHTLSRLHNTFYYVCHSQNTQAHYFIRTLHHHHHHQPTITQNREKKKEEQIIQFALILAVMRCRLCIFSIIIIIFILKRARLHFNWCRCARYYGNFHIVTTDEATGFESLFQKWIKFT